MVRIEEIQLDENGREVIVKGETDNNQQQQGKIIATPFTFVLASPIWYISIIVGLSMTAFLAFADLEPYKSPLLLRLFMSIFIGRQLIMQLIFFAAIALHILEGLIVVVLCPTDGVDPNVRLAWIAQTFLLGYPSLKPFFIQLEKHMFLTLSQKKRL